MSQLPFSAADAAPHMGTSPEVLTCTRPASASVEQDSWSVHCHVEAHVMDRYPP